MHFGNFLTTCLLDPIFKMHLHTLHQLQACSASLPPFNLLLTIGTMGRGNNDLQLSLRVPFLLLLTFLMISPHLASCRSIRRSHMSAATAVLYSRFSQQLNMEIPATRSGENGTETDPVYGVSKRAVPGGPNPLHN
ncbi:hypothetical protein SAY87_029443 [Trapa incisa]|nr:hypothetical protein SAY87_029443 [Trapa incisa]